MRILIHNVERTDQRRDLQRMTTKEAGFATRRLRWLMPRITLVLSQMESTGSGVDKRCAVEMKSRRAGIVIATATARDWLTAITLALRVASRRLSDVWHTHSLSTPPVYRHVLALQRARVR